MHLVSLKCSLIHLLLNPVLLGVIKSMNSETPPTPQQPVVQRSENIGVGLQVTDRTSSSIGALLGTFQMDACACDLLWPPLLLSMGPVLLQPRALHPLVP